MSTEKPIDIGNLVSLEMPPVTVSEQPAAPAAPVAPVRQTAAANSKQAVDVDSLKRPFDPAKFVQEKDSLGRWKNKRAGRRSKGPMADPAQTSFIPSEDRGTSAVPASAEAAAAAAAEPAGPDRFTVLADVYTRGGLAAAAAIMSDEWFPDNDAEFIGLRDSVASYLRVTQQDDLPPGWALVLAVGTYGAKRLPRPKTQSRISFFKERVTAWWRGRSIARALDRLPEPSEG